MVQPQLPWSSLYHLKRQDEHLSYNEHRRSTTSLAKDAAMRLKHTQCPPLSGIAAIVTTIVTAVAERTLGRVIKELPTVGQQNCVTQRKVPMVVVGVDAYITFHSCHGRPSSLHSRHFHPMPQAYSGCRPKTQGQIRVQAHQDTFVNTSRSNL